MSFATDSSVSLEELRSLLEELPLDEAQQRSVAESLGKLPAQQVDPLLQYATNTLRNVENALVEIDEFMSATTVQIASTTAVGRAFNSSVSSPV